MKILFPVFILALTSISAMAAPSSGGTITTTGSYDKLRSDYAMKGFSIGLATSHTILEAKIKTTGTYGSVENVGRSDEMRASGIMARYSLVPKQGVGFDGNMTFQKSSNHKDLDAGEFNFFKAEGNVVGSFRAGKHVSIYGLTGLNMNYVSGNQVEDSIQPIGVGAQIGVGVAATSSLNLEIVYTANYHKFSDKFRNRLAEWGTSIDNDNSYIIFKGTMARVNYSF